MQYPGAKWYKCDLHIHSSASKCFEDEQKSIESLLDCAIENGLDCIAITDHNTAANIDEIKALSSERDITVFPGVEITCSDAKIHILVIFDLDITQVFIEDFLVSLGLKREVFGEQEAHIDLNLSEVLDKIETAGGLAIPAHVDEFNGLSKVAKGILDNCFKNNYVLGVQISNEMTLRRDISDEELLVVLRNKYGEDIDLSTVKSWRSINPYLSSEIAVMTFSDNPNSDKSPKHGLWGIGNQYTWIKMGSTPTLEGLKQALIMSTSRVKNIFESPDCPYIEPNLWLKKLIVRNSELNINSDDIVYEFNPQLNCIIGGRGSGKSSFIHFLRGILQQDSDIEPLTTIHSEFKDFYRVKNKNKKGVLSLSTEIIAEIVVANALYRVMVKDFKENGTNATIIDYYSEKENDFIEIENAEFLKLLNMDIFSQKQIFELSTTPSVLREMIDKEIGEIAKIYEEITLNQNSYIDTSRKIRQKYDDFTKRKSIEAELQLINNKISTYTKSGIDDLISKKNIIEKEKSILDGYIDKIKLKQSLITDSIKIFEIPEILAKEELQPSSKYDEELNSIIKVSNESLVSFADNFKIIESQFNEFVERLLKTYIETQIIIDYNLASQEIDKLLIELASSGLSDAEKFKELIEQKNTKEGELKAYDNLEKEILDLESEKKKAFENTLSLYKQISKVRNQFLKSLNIGEMINIKSTLSRDFDSFELEFRNVIGKQTEYQSSIDTLLSKLMSGNVMQTIQLIHNDLDELRMGKLPSGYDPYFKNFIAKLDADIFEKLFTLVPHDLIVVSYKTLSNPSYRSIAYASAGQKTSSILSYILSFGKVPLILDQPEDDLDNHLIYNLIVDRLLHSKSNRQIIIVTHNANIPVNGDAELINVMNSETKNIQVIDIGSIDDKSIIYEICGIMEGGEDAFKTRSKRYHLGELI